MSTREGTGLGASFWRLFAASSTSNLSDGVLQAALPLLAATLTRDPVAVSLMAALAFLPWLLFAYVAGAVVDRVDRRLAMTLANAFRAVVLALLAGSVAFGFVSLPLLYTVAFLLGTAETVYDNAARAILPNVVARRQLERGNSILVTAESVGNIFLGAPVGAWLFALAASVPLWFNAGAYVLAAGLALTVAGTFTVVRTHETSMRHDMAEGLRWLFRHRLLRSLMFVTALSAFANAMFMGVMVLFALQDLGLSARLYGLLLAAAGVGAVLGSLASPVVTRLVGRTGSMGLSMVLGFASVTVMGLWPHPVLGAAMFAVSAGSVSVFNVQIMSVRQALVPDHLYGRVQGAYRTVLWGGIPLGSLTGGLVGAWVGVSVVFVISGALGVLVGVATYVVLLRGRDEIAAAFAEEGQEPDPAGDSRASDPVSP